MEYKELIARLNAYSAGYYAKYQRNDSITAEAATAIETLLAEREAAVEEIEKRCDNCEYLDVSAIEWPCAGCGAECSEWKWRGPTPPDCE